MTKLTVPFIIRTLALEELVAKVDLVHKLTVRPVALPSHIILQTELRISRLPTFDVSPLVLI